MYYSLNVKLVDIRLHLLSLVRQFVLLFFVSAWETIL